jgi:uncharacterized membrane protein
MNAPHADQIINGYLARLEAALQPLPAARRLELMDDVRAHIAEARAALPAENDADLLNILDRLGDPVETAAAAMAEYQPKSAVPVRSRTLEILAVILLVVFWPAGVVLLWLSDVWTRRDKLIGTLVPPGGFSGVFIFGLPVLLLGTHSGSGPCISGSAVDSSGNVVITPTTCAGPVESLLHVVLSVLLIVLTILLLISPILTAIYLAIRLRRATSGPLITASSFPPVPPSSGSAGDATHLASDQGAAI